MSTTSQDQSADHDYDPRGDLEPEPAPDAADVPPRAGTWAVPERSRHYGDPFNKTYEDWVRDETNGVPDQEYLVEHGGERAWFDATTVQERDGQPTEVLLDAKGRYAQFIDRETGEFEGWWADSTSGGLPEMIQTARRQVRVADSRPVEWWCAERDTARAFNVEFENDDRLDGRIRAVHRPMP